MAPAARHARHARRVTVKRLLAASPRRIFLVAFVFAFLNLAVWSLATPLFASPDEPTHVARAVALVRGELIGRTIGNAGNAHTGITIPELYAEGGRDSKCFAFKDKVPASCAPNVSRSAKELRTSTYAGRYPPLYYAVVGLPSLLTVSPAGLYLMRLTSDVLSAVFLALAIMSIVEWSSNRRLLIGLLLAATPMVFFLGGVVNPSGLEIASAICLWSSGLVLALERSQAPPPGLVVVVAVSMATLTLARGMSPLWVAVIIGLLALLTGRQGLLGIAHSRVARWSLVALLPCAAFALTWIRVAHALDLVAEGHIKNSPHTFYGILLENRTWITQIVGVFGWLDTGAPLLTYLVWAVVVGLLAALVALFVRFRYSVVLFLTGVIVLVVPAVVSLIEVHRLGLVWQGRYIMPVAVGFPLIATAILRTSRRLLRFMTLEMWMGIGIRGRLTNAILVGIGVAQFAAFTETLRRYVVGVSGPINFLNGPWHPPFGVTTLLVAALLITTLMLTFMRYLISTPQSGSANVERTRSHIFGVHASPRHQRSTTGELSEPVGTA